MKDTPANNNKGIFYQYKLLLNNIVKHEELLGFFMAYMDGTEKKNLEPIFFGSNVFRWALFYFRKIIPVTHYI